jgi:iron complex outermembrane receptor protein
LLAASLALMMAGVTHAQIAEVTVTAQRLPSPESKTPVAMSVLSASQLTETGIDHPAGLSTRLPNVELDNAADGLRITIRGVSNSDTTEKGDPSAAFMLDGIYIARPQIQNLSFYDLERVEVLRGPQGTLYGRNTTAGVVNVMSKTPSERFEASAGTELGNYRSRKANAMLNVPLGDALALRAALAYNRHDSYLRNGQGTPFHLGLDRDDLSARISARLKLGDGAALVLRYDRSKVDDNNDSFVPDTNFYTGVASHDPRWHDGGTGAQLTNSFKPRNSAPEQGYSRKTADGIGADLSWKLGAATLYYLGSHRSYRHDALFNFYYRVTPAVALGVHHNFSGDYAQNSHELRFATDETRTLSAQAGVYYFRERSSQLYSFRDLNLIGLSPYYVFPHGPTISTSKALFGQATWRIGDKLRATAGARYTDDQKSRVGSTNFQQASTFNPATDFKLLNAASMGTHQATWRLGADYDLTAAALLYGAVATGYKAGGFNDGCPAGTVQQGLSCPASLAVPVNTLLYQPETVRSHEAGMKSRFWQGKASLNLSVFKYDYKNLQLSGVAIVQGAPRFVTGNAGVASVKGLEAEGQLRPTQQDRFRYALALLDAHYVNYRPDGVHSWAGVKLDRAPAHTLMLGYEHGFRLADGELAAGLGARRSGAYIIAVPTQLLQYRIPARTESDATLRYQRKRAPWSVMARVKNIENKVHPLSIDSFGMVVPSDPRTVDVRLDYRF